MADVSTETSAAFVAGNKCATFKERVINFGDEQDYIPVALVNADQRVEICSDLVSFIDSRRGAPRRRTGMAEMSELDSFVDHVNRFKSESSAIFANVSCMILTAVYNYHPAGADGGAAWCDHGSRYVCPRSPAWLEWSMNEGKAMSQDDFADFIDDRLEDVASGDLYPEPAKLLEVARSLRIHTKGTFARRTHPTTGDFDLVCKQETESSSTPIPRAFLIGVPVFIGGAVYRIEARIRFKVRDGRATFSYQLHRRDEIVNDAFGEVRDIAAEKTKLPVFAGKNE